MWKHSHYIVASKISEIFGLTRFQRLGLIYGSLVPDLKPSCFYKPHTYDNWCSYANKLLDKIDVSNKNIIYYYRFGKLLHLYSDFYTRPHNLDGIITFINSHIKWEKELDFQITNFFKLGHSPLINSLSEMRVLYKYEFTKENVLIDLMFIESACYYLCIKVGLM